MPRKRRENVVEKMLVMKQMMQVVEVSSPIQIRCPRRSELMRWHWRRRILRRAGNELVSLDQCRRGDDLRWDGIWGCELTRSTPRRG